MRLRVLVETLTGVAKAPLAISARKGFRPWATELKVIEADTAARVARAELWRYVPTGRFISRAMEIGPGGHGFATSNPQ